MKNSDARDHRARHLLTDSPCQDDAEQIVAELAANAIQYKEERRVDEVHQHLSVPRDPVSGKAKTDLRP